MSFKFDWPEFTDEFYAMAREQISNQLDQISNEVISNIVIEDLHFGSIPPQVEIMEISQLDIDKLKGIVKVSYGGDAFIKVQANVQINPLHGRASSPLLKNAPLAFKPLVMPLTLNISDLKLDAVLSVGYNLQHGLTINFKNDPLHKVKITSTFDELGVNDLLTNEITERIRSSLREVLPRVLHQMSLSWKPAQLTASNATGESSQQHSNSQMVSSQSTAPQVSIEDLGEKADTVSTQSDQRPLSTSISKRYLSPKSVDFNFQRLSIQPQVKTVKKNYASSLPDVSLSRRRSSPATMHFGATGLATASTMAAKPKSPSKSKLRIITRNVDL